MAELPRHVLVIGLEDRPGAVHGVSEVFSGRGLQMEAFFGTSDTLTANGQAQALVVFRATDERARLVTRVVQRLSSVRSADLWSDDNPRLVLSVIVEAPGTPPEGVSVAPLGPDLALVAGPPRRVHRWLDAPGAPARRGAYRLDAVGPTRATASTPSSGTTSSVT